MSIKKYRKIGLFGMPIFLYFEVGIFVGTGHEAEVSQAMMKI